MSEPHRTTHTAGEQLGAQYLPGTGQTRFRVWTTTAQRVEVRLDGVLHALAAQGEGLFEATLPAESGSRYIFVLDGLDTPDPYARFLPDGVHGEAEVIDLSRYEFQALEWRGLKLSECVFYELHIGTFTPEGTYAAAAQKLPYLRELGITAVELMPIAAYAGGHGWGYDGVAFYAPHAAYGRPEELQAFVDAAHGLGLAVVLDVVYNHFGPDGNYLSRYSPQYFTGRFSSAWGEGLDYAERHMRRLITESARMWLREYHFDGLRLDATQSMPDDSPTHILAELAHEVHKLGGDHLLLAEDYRNLPMLVTDYHLDGIWVDDFHHQVRVTLTGDQDGYYMAFVGGAQALATTINQGWMYQGEVWPLEDAALPFNRRGESAHQLEAPSFVYFIQNHDQIGNRAQGDRVHDRAEVSPAAYRGASTLLLSLPMTPLLFMGQEWAASTPFPFFSDHHGELGHLVSEGRKKEFGHFKGFAGEILDPQDRATFEMSRLNWPEREEGQHAQTWRLYRDLLKLRKQDEVLSGRTRQGLLAGHAGGLLWVKLEGESAGRQLLWNTSDTALSLCGVALPFDLLPDLIFYSEADGKPLKGVSELPAGAAIILGGKL